MVSPEKKENLGLEGELFRVLIKINEEGILIHILKQGLAVHFFRKHPGKARLADPKGSFDGNVLVHLDVARYPSTHVLSQESALWGLFGKIIILFLEAGLVKKRGEGRAEVEKVLGAEGLGSPSGVYGTALHSVQSALHFPRRKRASQGV